MSSLAIVRKVADLCRAGLNHHAQISFYTGHGIQANVIGMSNSFPNSVLVQRSNCKEPEFIALGSIREIRKIEASTARFADNEGRLRRAPGT
jgi:hypothetical protein